MPDIPHVQYIMPGVQSTLISPHRVAYDEPKASAKRFVSDEWLRDEIQGLIGRWQRGGYSDHSAAEFMIGDLQVLLDELCPEQGGGGE